MELRNPFSIDTRQLYWGIWYCWICGSNGNGRGGLELHHIRGRISASALNSALLCHECHSGMNHNQEEERMLFLKTLKFLHSQRYIFTQADLVFMEENKERLFSDEVVQWVNTL